MGREGAGGLTLRFFLDTEFNDELGDFRIEPISIALVSENGEREMYAESSEFSEAAAHPWLHENVIPKLGPRAGRVPLGTIRDMVARYLADAVRAAPARADKLQIWAKNGALDQAVLGLLFGGLSRFYEYVGTLGIERTYFNDTDMLRREAPAYPAKEPRADDKKHHALHDARNERQEYLTLVKTTHGRPF